MRRLHFPMVVALAGIASQVAMTSNANGWENPAVEINDSTPPMATSTPRYVDEAVKQAGYYDSRPRPESDSATGQRGAPLFRGESLHWPKMPFGRQQSAGRPVDQRTQSSMNRTMPNGVGEMNQSLPNGGNPMDRNRANGGQMAAGQAQQRVANPKALAGRTMQPRAMSASQPAVRPGNNQNLRNSANRPPMLVGQEAVQRPMPVAARPGTAMPAVQANNNMSNMTSVSPWQTRPNGAPVAQAAPVAMPTAIASQPKPASSPSQADRIVAQCHELSTSASTEEDYSRIIEGCRRAQAIQSSPETAKYATSLLAWALNRRGQLKADEGQNQLAVRDFDEAVRCDASCWRAAHNRGVLLAQDGQFEKAFDDFTHTIQLNPKFAKAYSNRAALFMVANNLDAALKDYYLAIEMDNNLAVAHRGCGRVLQLMGRSDEAMEHYDVAVRLAPNDAFLAACRADLLTDMGRYSDALNEYNRAIQVDARSGQAHCGSAWLLATCPDSSLRNPQLALERAKTAIELSDQPDAFNFDTLAAAQACAGDFTAATQSVRKAIEMAPAEERVAYQDRLLMYQQAKPFRLAPTERVAQQTNYEAGHTDGSQDNSGVKRF